ncbi:MAG: co-chaperone GroES [Bacteroidales bacterium]|jgi:co-chaperonin GroES (HSP10)|nr:co-chaperone GroES [Bacteroidales bacterium]
MTINLKEKDLEQLVIMGDKVLIKPKFPQEKTQSGLFLPPSVIDREQVSLGYVIKTGPGYPIPAVNDYDEPWKDKSENVKYVPLQAKRGDLAVFQRQNSIEIQFNSEKYYIISASAILMCVRDEGLLK